MPMTRQNPTYSTAPGTALAADGEPAAAGGAPPEAPAPVAARLVRSLTTGLQAAGAVLRLVRPLNFVLFIAGVAVGGVLVAEEGTFGRGEAMRLLLAGASAALLGGAANALNDVFDLEIDRINRPRRPLPSGQLSLVAARSVWFIGTVGGLALGLWLSVLHALVAAAAAVLLFAYNAWLKRALLVGNVVVAAVVALALVYGGAAVGPPGPALVGAAFAFLTTLAREVIKDVEDVAGDAVEGAHTLPLVFGTGVALAAAAGVLVLTLTLTPVPFLWLGYSSLYLLLVLVADLLMLRVLWLLQGGESARQTARASRLMKWAMAAGMAALACAGAPD